MGSTHIENVRDESFAIRSESVPNTPDGTLNVEVPLPSYESSLEARAQWMGINESASSFGACDIYIPDF